MYQILREIAAMPAENSNSNFNSVYIRQSNNFKGISFQANVPRLVSRERCSIQTFPRLRGISMARVSRQLYNGRNISVAPGHLGMRELRNS